MLHGCIVLLHVHVRGFNAACRECPGYILSCMPLLHVFYPFCIVHVIVHDHISSFSLCEERAHLSCLFLKFIYHRIEFISDELKLSCTRFQQIQLFLCQLLTWPQLSEYKCV